MQGTWSCQLWQFPAAVGLNKQRTPDKSRHGLATFVSMPPAKNCRNAYRETHQSPALKERISDSGCMIKQITWKVAVSRTTSTTLTSGAKHT